VRDRRHFLKTGFSLAAAGLAGAAALTGARRTVAEEAPPETTSLRLGQYPVSCFAPLYILDDLLREEGFDEIRYVAPPSATLAEIITRREVDFGLDLCPSPVSSIDLGRPVVMLAGVHLGCAEVVARESVRSVADLRGKNLFVTGTDVGNAEFLMLSLIVASVGLDPAKDIHWVTKGWPESANSFAAGEVDAFLAIPPYAQELRARGVGHAILSTVFDHPWSQYFCCMLVSNADFVRRNPIATKRVVRAILRAADMCVAKPDWVAHRLVDRGFLPRYDPVRQGLSDVSYRGWREFDAEDAVRFYALRLRELGMIKSSPDQIIATGTDWRFLKEVRKEWGI
jgi:NitT/TauT family transport system substrate-binding protein